jgi:SAM-dependent methyltransferase
MSANDENSNAMAEEARIRRVYRARDSTGKAKLYAWHRPEVRYQSGIVETVFANRLWKAFGVDLRDVTVVDVGCGAGGLLRQLVEWGATPGNLFGVDLLKDRLQHAANVSPPGINWHLGGLDTLEDPKVFDLVIVSTVFTSILEDSARRALGTSIWRRVRPGGWIFVFDFRYDNPRNASVRKLTRRQLLDLWPDGSSDFQPILLAPPLARRIVPFSKLLAGLMTLLLPFTRTHFMHTVQKKTGSE